MSLPFWTPGARRSAFADLLHELVKDRREAHYRAVAYRDDLESEAAELIPAYRDARAEFQALARELARRKSTKQPKNQRQHMIRRGEWLLSQARDRRNEWEIVQAAANGVQIPPDINTDTVDGIFGALKESGTTLDAIQVDEREWVEFNLPIYVKSIDAHGKVISVGYTAAINPKRDYVAELINTSISCYIRSPSLTSPTWVQETGHFHRVTTNTRPDGTLELPRPSACLPAIILIPAPYNIAVFPDHVDVPSEIQEIIRPTGEFDNDYYDDYFSARNQLHSTWIVNNMAPSCEMEHDSSDWIQTDASNCDEDTIQFISNALNTFCYNSPHRNTTYTHDPSHIIYNSIEDDIASFRDSPWPHALPNEFSSLKLALEMGRPGRLWNTEYFDIKGFRVLTEHGRWIVGEIMSNGLWPDGKDLSPRHEPLRSTARPDVWGHGRLLIKISGIE